MPEPVGWTAALPVEVGIPTDVGAGIGCETEALASGAGDEVAVIEGPTSAEVPAGIPEEAVSGTGRGIIVTDGATTAEVAVGISVGEAAGSDDGPALEPPAAQAPTGAAPLLPVVVTSGPGSGNMTSVLSAVVQPLLILARKRSGRDLNATDGA